jgi:Protein of unknown function (DUF3102)
MSTGLVERNEHVRRITAAWQKTVANIIETGRLLIEAKDDIGFGGFQEMIRTELPFGPGTAQRLMQIAEDRVLSNAAHAPLLPASWMTLYELAKLPKHGIDLQILVEEGAIHPRMERKDVRALLPAPEPAPEPEQRDDDLPPDYEGSAESEVEPAKPTDKHGRRKLVEIEVKRLASKLVELDRDLARELHKLCCEDVLGWQYQLESALARELGLEIEGNEPSAGNGVDPEASAKARMAQFAEDPERWINGDPA